MEAEVAIGSGNEAVTRISNYDLATLQVRRDVVEEAEDEKHVQEKSQDRSKKESNVFQDVHVDSPEGYLPRRQRYLTIF
ncbi:MAG: hypothetical protein V1848_00985 [Candidatus Magasanikbacteria bacterium]